MSPKSVVSCTFFVLFLCVVSSLKIYSQTSKLYVLAYKYSEGDKYRITSSTYKNFSTISASYTNSTSGETTFDLYQEVLGVDDEACDMKIRIELTRQTVNGKNLTYKLANVLKGDEVILSFDRFGKILPKSVEYHSSDTLRARSQQHLSLLRNIFLPLPDRALKTGDTWAVSEVFDEEQLAALAGSAYGIEKPEVQGMYTLESIDEGKAKIVLSLEVSGNGKLSELRDLAELDFLMQITGTFYFNVTEGKIVGGNISVDAAGITTIGQQSVDFKGSHISTFAVEKYK